MARYEGIFTGTSGGATVATALEVRSVLGGRSVLCGHQRVGTKGFEVVEQKDSKSGGSSSTDLKGFCLVQQLRSLAPRPPGVRRRDK